MADAPRRSGGLRLTWRTTALGVTAGATAAAFLGFELRRIWRLGSLPEQQAGAPPAGAMRRIARMARIFHNGYGVSRARRNAAFNMLVSFMVTLGATRAITVMIRNGIGPFGNVKLGNRHVHHFVPGMLLCMVCGGVALGTRSERLQSWLAVPFGGGVALVLDETAMLLELEDVYWSAEGVLSLQVAFAGLALLAAVAYSISFLRLGTTRLLESDWTAAARAWEDLSGIDGAD